MTNDRVSDTRPLVTFLYLLGRDHLALGVVDGMLERIPGQGRTLFTNPHLARWAQEGADRLSRAGEDKADG